MAETLASRKGTERGAALVMVSIMLLALMTSAALVVDLGIARHARRSNQAAADFAALAAGEALGNDPAPDPVVACADAVQYLIANVDGIDATVSVPCASLPNACAIATAPVTITDGGTAGNYNIAITYPVADATLADSTVAAASSLRNDDGVPCERMEVGVTYNFESLFAGIVGKETFSITSDATVRQVQSSDRRVPALWLLEPHGCLALEVSGGSSVSVGTATAAGLITIDSDATTCGGTSFSIDANGAGTSITAVSGDPTQPPQISLVGMERLQASCLTGNLNACDPADVAGSTVTPQPVRRALRATRAPIDHSFNCKSTYPDYHGIPIEGCTNGTGAYIDQLVSEVGAAGTPLGFNRWSDFYGCNNPAVPATGIAGNWHVDCVNFRLNTNNVAFNGGNVVFDGNVNLSGGSLSFNTANPTPNLPTSCLTTVVGCIAESSSDAAWVVMRTGNLTLTGGVLIAQETLIYQASGYFSIGGGSPPVWSSPIEGPFNGLSVWSELASSKYKINGGASMELAGTFFTPEATPVSISGGSPVTPQQAQFVSRELAVTGGAALTLSPNPLLAVVLPPDPPLLIR
jgi:hypothetical protein